MFILDGRKAFYQWDLGQKITSEKFKVGDQIHFTNSEQSTALVLIAYELNGKVVVDVPNILLQSDIPLTVYRYIKTTNGSYTIEQQEFYVVSRTKPDDYIYTETEYHTVEKAVEEALALAKENGEFKGDKGDKGDAGVVKFIPVVELPTANIDENAIYLAPATNIQNNNTFDEYVYINGAWEKIGSASVEVNLDEYVKNIDYATKDKAGLVRVLDSPGLRMLNKGLLVIYPADIRNIDNRTPVDNPAGAVNSNNANPIVPATLDYAVRAGVTTNKYELTDEEKAAACKWMGANGKLETINTITTTEEANTIDVTTDINGNTFDLDEILVTVEMPKLETARTFYLYLGDNDSSTLFSDVSGITSFIISWKRDTGIASYKRCIYSTIELKTELFNFTEDNAVINSFKITDYDNPIPVGTKITVKGIRK